MTYTEESEEFEEIDAKEGLTRESYQLISIDPDGYLTLMHYNGNTRSDLKAPTSDMRKQMEQALEDGKKNVDVTVRSAKGEDVVESFESR